MGPERSGLNEPRKTKAREKHPSCFYMEFAQQEQSGAVACCTREHNDVVPGSPFHPCVQRFVVLDCPSEVVNQ